MKFLVLILLIVIIGSELMTPPYAWARWNKLH